MILGILGSHTCTFSRVAILGALGRAFHVELFLCFDLVDSDPFWPKYSSTALN